MSTMPSWLQRHLIATGRWDADRIHRKAEPRHHHCGLVVIVGLDAERAALPAIADPTPLSPLGEALALLDGRRTYTLRDQLGQLQLDHRSPETIRYSPAGTRPDRDVVAEHRCQTDRLPTIPTALNRPTTTIPEVCPF